MMTISEITAAIDRGLTADEAAELQVVAFRKRRSITSDVWPDKLDGSALIGLPGKIVRTIEPHTEADSAAILIQLLVAFGCAVGRGPHYLV